MLLNEPWLGIDKIEWHAISLLIKKEYLEEFMLDCLQRREWDLVYKEEKGKYFEFM